MRTRFEFLSKTGCLLCDELHNTAPLSVRAGLSGHPYDNFLIESTNFVFLPDISPLLPGHCLMVPRDHFPSFAAIPKHQVAELRDFTDMCVAFISRLHSPPLLFEHGSGPFEPRSGACVHHAHTHFLPLSAPVETWMGQYGRVLRTDGTALCELPRPFGDYLSYQDQAGRSYLVSKLDRRPPCQFLRRKIAEHRGLPDWDWEYGIAQNLILNRATARGEPANYPTAGCLTCAQEEST
jgi:diadenosine tetraphosphate (Ap4A) HIT family hydrolase